MIDIDGVLYRLCLSGFDTAFPEFGWVRDSRGWRATNEQVYKSVAGASQRRVVCHGPMGFLAHGGGNTTWFQYVSGERKPGGEAFKQRLETCAQEQVLPTARPITEEERIEIERESKTLGSVLEDIWQLVRNELTVEELMQERNIWSLVTLAPKPDGGTLATAIVRRRYVGALRPGIPRRTYRSRDLLGRTRDGEVGKRTLWDSRIVGKYLSKRGI